MYETDRDAYLALAKALQMDFNFMSQIIDGRRQASAGFARVLTEQTNTWDRLWTAEGKAQERLMAVRVWYAARANAGPASRFRTRKPPGPGPPAATAIKRFLWTNQPVSVC